MTLCNSYIYAAAGIVSAFPFPTRVVSVVTVVLQERASKVKAGTLWFWNCGNPGSSFFAQLVVILWDHHPVWILLAWSPWKTSGSCVMVSSNHDLCLLLCVIRLVGWLEHCIIFLSLSIHDDQPQSSSLLLNVSLQPSWLAFAVGLAGHCCLWLMINQQIA